MSSPVPLPNFADPYRSYSIRSFNPATNNPIPSPQTPDFFEKNTQQSLNGPALPVPQPLSVWQRVKQAWASQSTFDKAGLGLSAFCTVGVPVSMVLDLRETRKELKKAELLEQVLQLEAQIIDSKPVKTLQEKGVPLTKVLKKYFGTWNALGCVIALGATSVELNQFRKKVFGNPAEQPASPMMPIKPFRQY